MPKQVQHDVIIAITTLHVILKIKIMNSFFTIIKSDYLQRTRSYAFLITLCISLAVAYTFVPEPNANYSTIRIGDYIGNYNSAWFGYVTAIMTSLFLSLIGFYLINNSIETDIRTKVGQIIASTKIGNFTYLVSKVLSNFLVLLTILLIIFTMSIVLFFLYNDGYPFEIFQFIKPYVIITIPTLFVIAVLAVVFEVLLGKHSVMQNIGFFCLFCFFIMSANTTKSNFSIDLLGSKIVMHQLEKEVREITKAEKQTNLNIGYVIGNKKETERFLFNGMDFPMSFIISRILWILSGIGAIGIITLFFHRFNIKERTPIKKKAEVISQNSLIKDISLARLTAPKINYRILPILKTEIILLYRKGKKWLWVFNAIGIVLLAFVPLSIAHQLIIPVLWFLQVSRLSELTTKEISNRVHYFAFASYKPITRLLVSQILAGIVLLLLLALPLLIRLTITTNTWGAITVILGGVFIVLLATTIGILTQSKKLFEVLFFMVTYANINKIPFLDYFGGLPHGLFYILQLTVSVLVLAFFGFMIRKQQLKRL